MIELEKAYNPDIYEQPIYQSWLDSGFFNPDNLPERHRDPYCIVMPPPNVTGVLHIGHSLMVAIEDVLVRYHRMKGFKTLWIPGTDHAAIATQSKVEKLLEKEGGQRKQDLGREEFLKRVEQFAQESHDTIVNQIKRMGASVDWTREAYTLDEARTLAVKTAFKNMYDNGLIERHYKVVNWDPKGQTVISDDETVHQERPSTLYTFKYSADFPIAISTTRPETKVGDVAVAVHPEDKRYSQFVGKSFPAKFCGVDLDIKIIADDTIDPDFGTGALGVTPAHSQIDWEIADRHALELKPVINEYAKMTEAAGELLAGLKVSAAREAVVNWLREQDLLEKEETVSQNVATAERTGGIIEPLPKLQWFIRVNKPFILKHSAIPGITDGSEVTLKQLMRHVVENNRIDIFPEHFSKTYFHWIDNLRDWCISRQIWYGHRIPVWYKQEQIYCDVEPPDESGWEQDPDTLDTWFSSGLWTFSTLGWPNKNSSDFQTFHPTQVLETGYDILFFWVARMILMSTYHLGDIPFQKVFLHGLVRDKNREKISKSKGNAIDPIEMIEKYGTDALRFGLVFNTAPGTDIALAEDKIKGMKHFANKLWNIARFILSKTDRNDFQENLEIDLDQATPADKAIIEKLNAAINKATSSLDEMELHAAAQEIYQFTWHELADIYVEASKEQLENPTTEKLTRQILSHSLISVLKLLHPFMPFVTEAIWAKLEQPKLLLVSEWPKLKI